MELEQIAIAVKSDFEKLTIAQALNRIRRICNVPYSRAINGLIKMVNLGYFDNVLQPINCDRYKNRVNIPDNIKSLNDALKMRKFLNNDKLALLFEKLDLELLEINTAKEEG